MRKPARRHPCTTSARFCIRMQGVDNPEQAPLRPAPAPSNNPDIHLGEAYAVGCYLRHDGFPRRTLIGDSRLHRTWLSLGGATASALRLVPRSALRPVPRSTLLPVHRLAARP